MVYSLDDYMGLIGGAHWIEEARGLRISDGVLLLNGAQDRAAAGDAAAEQVMGGMKRLEFVSGLERPVIEDGVGKLPYAAANDGRSVAGGLRGVGYRAGLTWPLIEDGELWLPQPAAGEPGEPLVVPTADSASERYGTVVSIEPADPEAGDDWAICDGRIYAGLADVCSGRAGVLSGVEYSGDLPAPMISRGVLMLPTPSDAGLPGLYDAVNNVGVPWSSLQDGAVVRLSYSGGSQLGVSVTTFKGGYLAIMVDKA
jgi:hypothetical protein